MDYNIYDRTYYENGIESKVSGYVDYTWSRLGSYFQDTARHIVDRFSPLRVLDVGCAKGFMVRSLVELGVNAYGIDVSKYATANCDRTVANRIFRADASVEIPFKSGYFDLVLALDVMEHIPEENLDAAFEEIYRVCNGYFVIRVPTKPDTSDITHVTQKPLTFWIEMAARHFGTVLPPDTFLKNVWWFSDRLSLIVARK